jgi:LPXTG-motif cell wall-anchored protein
MEVFMRSKIMRCGFGVVLALLAMVATSSAQTWDERAYFTFGGPVELPGVGLAPGKYVFRLADPDSGRSIVQVLSADGKKAYGLFFTRAVERQSASNKPEIRFMEAPPGAPPAIKTWWQPGDRMGREFVYPKDRARQLAQSAKDSVLTTQAETTTTVQTNTNETSRIASGGQETRVNNDASTTASAPSGTAQSGERAPETLVLLRPVVTEVIAYTRKIVSTLPPPTRPAEATEARANLPQTGSSLPLVGLLGLCCVLGAAAFRSFRIARI